MANENIFINYYQVLECDRTASYQELKTSYMRLVLLSHPDKIGDDVDGKFSLIQQAWSVLKDPLSRKQYDAALTCHEHSDFLLYETVSLNNMDYDAIEELYTYPCRCGGVYIISAEESLSNTVIGCDECSFSIQIKV